MWEKGKMLSNSGDCKIYVQQLQKGDLWNTERYNFQQPFNLFIFILTRDMIWFVLNQEIMQVISYDLGRESIIALRVWHYWSWNKQEPTASKIIFNHSLITHKYLNPFTHIHNREGHSFIHFILRSCLRHCSLFPACQLL